MSQLDGSLFLGKNLHHHQTLLSSAPIILIIRVLRILFSFLSQHVLLGLHVDRYSKGLCYIIITTR